MKINAFRGELDALIRRYAGDDSETVACRVGTGIALQSAHYSVWWCFLSLSLVFSLCRRMSLSGRMEGGSV